MYEHILVRLTGVNDINIALEQGNFEEASRLSDEFADCLRLLRDGLGWGDSAQGSIELKAPADVVRRSLSRVKERAESEDRLEAEESAELETRRSQNRLVRETCSLVLADLEN
ncbi:MAG TPA: hypothetical protein VG448_13085 [Solirubrobacterales bacterium]|nr:hypothetical protein [Solirubrobacterales bacterium]